MIQEHIFRKYDIRATVGKDFDIEDIYELSRAIAYYLKTKDNSCNNIAIGMDGRIHSPSIKDQVIDAFIDCGFNVTFIGLCTTPALYFATHELNVNAGIMITASHNPAQDNGLKIVLNKESVWNEQIQQIKNIYQQNLRLTNDKPGSYTEYDIIDHYTNYLANEFKILKNCQISTVVDCGNGAAGSVLPTLIEKLNLKNIKLIFQDIDGNFPNHEPDPTVEQNLTCLKQILKDDNNYKFGIGFDGDCDRVAAMKKNGYLMPGDQLLGIFSQFVDTTKSKIIAFDVKCSNGLINLLKSKNLIPNICPTGIGYVKSKMKETNAVLGGELSGHICFKDRYYGFDDGIYAALRLFEILNKTRKSLDELLENFPVQISSPEYRIKCPEQEKAKIINSAKKYLATIKDVTLTEIDGIRLDSNYGWGLLRASNTESLLSLRFEANTEIQLNKIKRDFYDSIESHFDKIWLKEQLQLN